MTTPIKTIGDARRYLAQFPPEADDYPFVVWFEEEAFPTVDGGIMTNCDGHPDYAMLVVSHIEQVQAAVPAPDPDSVPDLITQRIDEIEALVNRAKNDDSKHYTGNEANNKARRLVEDVQKLPKDKAAAYLPRINDLVDRILVEIFGFTLSEAERIREDTEAIRKDKFL